MVCVSRLRKFRIAFAVVVDLASSDSSRFESVDKFANKMRTMCEYSMLCQGLGSNVEKLSKGMSMMCFEYVRAAVLCYARGASIRTVAQTHIGSTPPTAINSSVRLSAETIKVHIAQSITHQRNRIIVLPVLDRRPRQASRNSIDGVAPRTRRMTETIIDSGLERPLQDFHGEFARDMSAGSNPTESASAALFEGGGLGQVNAIAGLGRRGHVAAEFLAKPSSVCSLFGSHGAGHGGIQKCGENGIVVVVGVESCSEGMVVKVCGILTEDHESHVRDPDIDALFDEFAGRRTINAYLYSSPGLVQVAQPDLPLVSEIIAKAHLVPSASWVDSGLMRLSALAGLNPSRMNMLHRIHRSVEWTMRLGIPAFPCEICWRPSRVLRIGESPGHDIGSTKLVVHVHCSASSRPFIEFWQRHVDQ
ncbi:hypothetical protein KCU93_g219, partial [Aureobasidium melanogenum]